MNIEKVEKDELLYRAIKRSQPDAIDKKRNKVSSALFKDELGVSVDRDGKRAENIVVDSQKSYFAKRYRGTVRVMAEICLANNMAVIPEPRDENIFHASIYQDSNKNALSQLNALKLADAAEIVYYVTETGLEI